MLLRPLQINFVNYHYFAFHHLCHYIFAISSSWGVKTALSTSFVHFCKRWKLQILQGKVLKFKMPSSFSLTVKRHVYYTSARKHLFILSWGYCCCTWYLYTSIHVGIKHPPPNTHLKAHDTNKNIWNLKICHHLRESEGLAKHEVTLLPKVIIGFFCVIKISPRSRARIWSGSHLLISHVQIQPWVQFQFSDFSAVSFFRCYLSRHLRFGKMDIELPSCCTFQEICTQQAARHQLTHEQP